MVYAILIAFIFYFIISSLSIQWINKENVMNPFQRKLHIVLVLLLPMAWISLLILIYKPIPGYTEQRWKDTGSTHGDAGDYFEHPHLGHDSDGDGGD